jgi:radical SAM superfamily enzyme YgiQ (UPF0313 family)
MEKIMSKQKMFLIDLNYISKDREWSIIPAPLSIGYLASYISKMLPDCFDIELFKDPYELLEAIEREKPVICGFSNYIWNKNLQLNFAEHLKEAHPDCLTVMGGPNYNFDELDWVEEFARENPQIDFHIEGEGEAKFFNLVSCALENNFRRDLIEKANPAGITFINHQSNQLVSNSLEVKEGVWSCLDASHLDLSRGRLSNLDDIPSPYVTGIMDKFLRDPSYCPIIETNRGCPYSCTFCGWGAMGKSKSASFSMERVVEELNFIAEHNVSRSPYLYLGDANFGMFSRDVEIAKLLRKLKDSFGFPQNVYLYYAKNSSEKVIKIAELLKDMTPISLSRQSQNETVLKIIKRSNISIDTFNDLAIMAKRMGVSSFVELIYSLPGESKDSFFEGVHNILKNKVDGLHFFPAMLLHGSEMSTQKHRDEHGIKGEWRFIDGCAGEFGPIRAMEYEEIITSTDVLSRDDHFEIRLFHFLQTIFLDTKFYKEIELLIGGIGIDELILDIIRNYELAEDPFRNLINEFIAQSKAEFSSKPPTSWDSQDIALAKFKSVKLNPLYTIKLLYEDNIRSAFDKFLTDRLVALCGVAEETIKPLLAYLSARLYPFDGNKYYEVDLLLDVERFQNRPVDQTILVKDYVMDCPKTYIFHKDTTFSEFVEVNSEGLPLVDSLYDIVLHHSHKSMRDTLTSEISANKAKQNQQVEITEGSREIQNEGGWIY